MELTDEDKVLTLHFQRVWGGKHRADVLLLSCVYPVLWWMREAVLLVAQVIMMRDAF